MPERTISIRIVNYSKRIKKFVKRLKLMLNYGPFHRIWPSVDPQGNLYVSVSALRSFIKPICKLFKSEDFGNSWIELADFYSMDPRNTTTGQVFISQEGIVLVPVWDSNFYQFGKTWLAIYRSKDEGVSFEKVYSNPTATYGKHFFQNNFKNEIYLCAGSGGGGTGGSVRYVPANGLLLKSQDFGNSWEVAFKVEKPTALYDGVAFANIILISAREAKSVFRSDDKGETWSEKRFDAAARNIKKIDKKILVTSDSAVFVSHDEGLSWTKISCPIRNMVLRYPTQFRDRIIMTGVGWRSLVLATNLEQNEWRIAFDATKVACTNFMTRLALAGEYLFLGDEIEIGALLRVPINSLKYRRPFLYSISSLLRGKEMNKTFDSV